MNLQEVVKIYNGEFPKSRSLFEKLLEQEEKALLAFLI